MKMEIFQRKPISFHLINFGNISSDFSHLRNHLPRTLQRKLCRKKEKKNQIIGNAPHYIGKNIARKCKRKKTKRNTLAGEINVSKISCVINHTVPSISARNIYIWNTDLEFLFSEAHEFYRDH